MSRNKATTQIGLAIAGAMVVIFLAACVAIAVYSAGPGKPGTGQTSPSTTAQPKSAATTKAEKKQDVKLLTREEFKTKFASKNPNQVKEILGPPEKTRENVLIGMWYHDVWHYKNVCYDPISGKPDENVYLWFVQGVMVDIQFR